MRAYKVYAIEEGTVIDHIEPGNGIKVLDLLNLSDLDCIVTLGMRLESKKNVKKDIIKIEDKYLNKNELDKIALVAPQATINIIRNHKVDEKFNIDVPNEVNGIIRCPNPKCITRNQPVKSRFHKFSEVPLKMQCHYCEKVFRDFDLN